MKRIGKRAKLSRGRDAPAERRGHKLYHSGCSRAALPTRRLSTAGNSGHSYHQRFQVAYEYPVHFTNGLFRRDNTLLESVLGRFPGEERRLIVYIDEGVMRAWPRLAEQVKDWFAARPGVGELVRDPERVPGGERTKNGWNVVQSIMATIGTAHLCRHSFVMAIGGGSVLDMVGFAASLVHRGLRVIRVPTTTLAQCDAGVGVKTGMDEHGMKNFAGTFAPPAAVLVDFDFLRTLEPRYRLGGIAEAFKVAMIKDRAFFDFLCRNAARLRKGRPATLAATMRRAAILHLDHISKSGDPFEQGTARPLDFGHWAAHQIEILSNYQLGHGEAVAIGIAMDTCLAARLGHVTPSERDRLLSALERLGLAVWHPVLDKVSDDGTLEIMKGLEIFREHLGGRLTLTLPLGIGRKTEVHELDPAMLRQCLAILHERGSGQAGRTRPARVA